MSAAGVLAAVIVRLEDFLLEEGSAPATCGNDFKENVRSLVTYLRQVEPHFEGRHNDTDFGKQVTRLAYDIEDSVEHEVLLVQAGIKYLTRRGNKTSLRRNKKRIDELIKLYPKLSTTADQPASIFLPENSEDETVGMEDDLAEAMNIMEINSRVCIHGMAGVGKTLLARKVFDHPTTKQHMDASAWVCVSQESHVIVLLRSIIKHLSSNPSILAKVRSSIFIESFGAGELVKMIKEIMSEWRCVIILDHVWSLEAMGDELTEIFNYPGESKVVITSRNKLRYCRLHKVRFLTNKESFQLLEKKLRGDNSVMNKNVSLRSTLNSIISMCEGIPSEIIRIADILKPTEPKTWEGVVNDYMLKSEKGETSLMRNIALSYDYLPTQWKPCFLSLGQFPLILQEKLKLMWKAERFIVDSDAFEKCLTELGNRNLVLVTPEEDFRPASYEHQIMSRKLCILKGNEEGFVGIIDSQHGNTTACRAVIYLNGNAKEHDIISNIHVLKHSRAVVFFGQNSPCLLSQWSELKCLKRVRVLDFDGIDFRNSKISTCKVKLLHLRYLSFARCYLEEFPLSSWIFPFLETLDLRVRTKIVIPNVLWKMSNLRHLYFPTTYECKTGEKLSLKDAKKLELIENFHVGICDVDDLLGLGNLNILRVISDGENTGLNKLISTVRELKRPLVSSLVLKSLVLKDFDCYTPERLENLKDMLECDSIKDLHLEGCIRKMPPNLKLSQTFRYITFDGTEFQEDLMPKLGKLPNLDTLVLCNDAITFEKLCCCMRFSYLDVFEINNLESLKFLELESGSMANLEVLKIKHCHNLATLSENWVKIGGLQQIIIGSMPQEFKEQVIDLVKKQNGMGTNKIALIFEN